MQAKKKEKLLPLLKRHFHDSRKEIKEDSLAYIARYVREYHFTELNIQKIKQQLEHRSLEQILFRNMNGFRNISDLKQTAVVISYQKYTGGKPANSARKLICSKYPEMQVFYSQSRKYFQTNFDKLYNQFLRSVEMEVRNIFATAIYENPEFQRLHFLIYEERQRMQMMMLNRIPKHMPDLYPLARQLKRHFILHIGPTNSGKTFEALQAMKAAKRAIYLAPLRLLAYEIYDRFNTENVPCSMITGEEEIMLENASHFSATIETLNVMDSFDVAVIDEAQMIGDRKRGSAWTRAILGVCADTIHVCGDSSCMELILKIIHQCGDTYEIRQHERMVPLELDGKEFIFPASVKEKDALIVFSKKSVIAVTAELQKAGISASMIYGNLPYDVRMNEVRRFVEGETKVVVATDAIGMGLNLPIQRIVFLETRKFDGDIVRPLSVSEIKQIAGRAGRKGIFDVGRYTSEFRKKSIARAVEAELKPLETAKMSIPESIIHMEMPLSEILSSWSEMEDEDIYEKADLTEEISLCRILEKYVNDKKILYDLVTLGFRGTKKNLSEILIRFAMIEETGGDDKGALIQEVIDAFVVHFSEELDKMGMEELEELYFKYDLIYAYLRKFHHPQWMDEIISLKRECSAKIMDILRTQHLETRKCKACGCDLTWNYPYVTCLDCYIHAKN